MLMATDQKPQNHRKWYYPPFHHLNVNVMWSNITFLWYLQFRSVPVNIILTAVFIFIFAVVLPDFVHLHSYRQFRNGQNSCAFTTSHMILSYFHSVCVWADLVAILYIFSSDFNHFVIMHVQKWRMIFFHCTCTCFQNCDTTIQFRNPNFLI